jgi:hypothetical protein
MSDDKQRLIADLKAIAASIRDPTKREEVLKIIARLSLLSQANGPTTLNH